MTAVQALPAQRNYTTAVALIAIHVCAVLAFLPVFFSWPAFFVGVALYFITGGIGITLGYHRLLTHRSFRIPRPLEYLVALVGTLALQGGPVWWVATHRKHHAHSDAAGDPHDVHRGWIWAHIEWLYRSNRDRLHPNEVKRWAKDLIADPFYRFLGRNEVTLQIALGLALFLIGGWSWVFWGVFARLALTYHCTWLVNSAAHSSGYQSFRTKDRSMNCWWVALLAYGEGWHNNHHAFPFSARHGLKWYEFDMTWLTIRVLRALRIARNVRIPTHEMMDRLRLPQRGQRAEGSL